MAESFKGARLAPFVQPGIFDAATQFKDAGAVTTSAAATVDSAAKVVEAGTGLFRGCMILDVTELTLTDDANQVYDIIVQGSTDKDFGTAANIVELASLQLTNLAAQRSGAKGAITPGRYKIYFDNEHDGKLLPYLRMYTVVAGTSKSINYSAYSVPM